MASVKHRCAHSSYKERSGVNKRNVDVIKKTAPHLLLCAQRAGDVEGAGVGRQAVDSH